MLPTLWFRNRWAWGDNYERAAGISRGSAARAPSSVELNEYHYGKRWLLMEGAPELLFTENETNMERLFQQKSRTPYVKDAFHRYVIGGEREAVNPAMTGTKSAAHYAAEIAPGKGRTIRLRLTGSQSRPKRASGTEPARAISARRSMRMFDHRLKEADEFYEQRVARGHERRRAAWCSGRPSPACSGASRATTTMSRRWLEGDPTQPKPDPQR